MARKTAGNQQIAYSWDTNAALGQLALERDARRGTVLRSYTYGAGPLGITTRAGSYTYHTDRLGSVVALSDNRGNNVGSYRYTPYGENWQTAGSATDEADSNPLRFTGQYLDSDSGLYYMRAREYDPELGRFLEVDPKEAETDDPYSGSYVYADDQPTLLTDPSGLDPRILGNTLNCKRNADLCFLIRVSGYSDDGDPYQLRRMLSALYIGAGVEFEHVYDASRGKGKVLVKTLGPKGPGWYFQRPDGGLTKLEPPKMKTPTCSWICSLGFVLTQVYDCGSVLNCEVKNVLFFTPTPLGKGTRLMKLLPKAMKALKLERKAKKAKTAAEGAKAVEGGAKAAKAAERGTGVVEAGSLRVVGEGFSASERRAAQTLADQGHSVVLRKASGVGRTSDLLVDNVPYDVYTPITGDIGRIVSETAKKGSQVMGGGVVIDLSRSSLTPGQLGNILPRVQGVTSKISHIIVLP